jgi:hypothetical protein
MKATRTKLMAAAMAALLAFLPLAEASARGGFKGGGFRSATSRSFGASRSIGTARSPGWGSATRPSLASPSLSGQGFSSSRRSISGSRASVSSQRGLYDSAKKSGTLFSSKAEASQAFRSRYAKDYASTFAAEPQVRPSYIPSSTLIGGRNVNVVYNSGLGGYGYYHPSLGRWILYDALADSVIDHAMYNRGYYWGGAPVYLSHGPSFLSLAFALLVLLIIVSAIAKAASRRAAAHWDEGRRGGRY